MTPHRVVLAGAGPGHPGLLTLRAAECLRRADLVLYDRLVPEALLAHAPPTARFVCVETLHPEHPQRWPLIYAAMIDGARQGLRVVRLKGGDPLMFGRGAEEAQALRAAGLEYEIVPGVTAGLGASAFAGIPVTHRDHASAVAFVTGHESPGKPGSLLDWPALARFPGTLVFYMGVAKLPVLAETLISHGKDASTPAAVIHRGTTSRQKTVTATLGTLAASAAGLAAPSLVLIGGVADLRETLAWSETRPLFGQSVLIARPRLQAVETARLVEEQGGEAVLMPVVEIVPPENWSAVDAAIAKFSQTDWLVFTSTNGVEGLLGRLRATGRDLRALGNVKIAAIGPATANALRAWHLEPDVVPRDYISESLAEDLLEKVRGQRVLLARTNTGSELLNETLGAVAEVEQVAVYRQTDAPLQTEALSRLRRGEIGLVALTSSNIARGLARAMGDEGRQHVLEGRTRLVAISPQTSEAANRVGLPVAAVAEEYTVPGVLAAMARLVSARP